MSTSEQRRMAGRAIVAKVVADDVKGVVAAARAVLEADLDADESVAAELPDGTRVGSVKRSRPRRTAAVTDEPALLAWVEANHPDEIVRSVNPAYVEKLKASCKRHGEAVDETSGEIVPGVELREGAPSYLPQPADGAPDLVRARLAELLGGGLLELEPQQREAS